MNFSNDQIDLFYNFQVTCLYFFTLSCIDYCNRLLFGIVHSFNLAVSIVTCAKKRSWPYITQIIRMLIYKCVNGKANGPPYISSSIMHHDPPELMRIFQWPNLSKSHSQISLHNPSPILHQWWNCIPNEICIASSLHLHSNWC